MQRIYEAQNKPTDTKNLVQTEPELCDLIASFCQIWITPEIFTVLLTQLNAHMYWVPARCLNWKLEDTR